MSHEHIIYDSDPHFVIDAITRSIINKSAQKTLLIQGDHNAERFTFEMPRYIEGHDMTRCNKVMLHYLNLSTNGKDKSADVYEPTDFQISTDSEETVVFSWLLSANATKYAGSLSFAVRFACMNGNMIEYAWNTASCTSISVVASVDNTDELDEQYADIIESWYLEIMNAATAGVNIIGEAAQNAVNDINQIVGQTGGIMVSDTEPEHENVAVWVVDLPNHLQEIIHIPESDDIAGVKDAEHRSEIFNDYTNNTALGAFSSVHGKSSTRFESIPLPEVIYYKASRYATEYDGKYDFEQIQFTTDSTDAIGIVDKVYSYKDPYGNKRYTLWQDHYYKLGENETVNEVSPDDRIWNTILLEALKNGGSKFSLADGRASAVFGEDSVASGRSSFAAGQHSIASGDYAVAMGYQSVARSKHAVALGNTCKATGMNSFATGEKAEATGYASVALGGECNVASGNYSIASGSHSVGSGHMSRAIGIRCEASGDYALVFGTDAKATEWNAIAIGLKAEALGHNSLALGRFTKAVAEFQTVVGRANVPIDDKIATFIVGVGSDDANRKNGLIVYVNGCVGLGSIFPLSDEHATSKYYVDKLYEAAKNYADTKFIELDNIGTNNKALRNTGALVVGNQSEANGNYAYVLGYQCLSNGGKGSVAMCRGSQALGETAFAAGYNAEASGRHSVAIGRYAKATEQSQVAVGEFNAVENDAAFMVGIGNAEQNRRNGLVVHKDGRTSVGADPTSEMDVVTKRYYDNKINDLQNQINTLTELINSLVGSV